MQRLDDLEGECPFVSAEEPCPYGLTCRFLGTHRKDVSVECINACRNSSEMNVFSKDIQKLLWKNKMSFPKADAKLKDLGLLVSTDITTYVPLSCSFCVCLFSLRSFVIIDAVIFRREFT